MKDQQIEKLIRQPEGERLERRRDSTGDNFKAKCLSTLCAFANDLQNSGAVAYFFIGVNDDGTISGYRDVGAKDEEKLRHWLANWEIAPAPECTLTSYALDEGDVIVIAVKSSSEYICWFEKNAWVRVGSSTRKADALKLKTLGEQRLGKSFDGRSFPAATMEDVELSLFASYQNMFVSPDLLAENHREFEQQLAHQGFYDLRKQHPTPCGILFCGRPPQEFFPMAVIVFVRTREETLDNREAIIQEQTISGDLIRQVRIIDALLASVIETRHQTQNGGLQNLRLTNYPLIALREFFFNALMHRDYSLPAPIRFYCFANRIEISSPGGLVLPATPENFPNVSGYRNPVIVATMKKLGWVEQFGNGFSRAQKMLQANGNPPAHAEISAEEIKITIQAVAL